MARPAIADGAVPHTRVDPAQPPMEAQWAEAWLRLAWTRFRAGKHAVAAAAAEMACQLDASLADAVAELLKEVQDGSAQRVVVPSRGILVLELCAEPSAVDRNLTGGVVWNGGLQLARLLPSLGGLTGRRLLDLGSGTGVAGLSAAMCGANVLLGDLGPAIPLLERNIARNLLEIQRQGGSASALELDWRLAPDAEELQGFDLVLACDVFWRADQCEPVVRWLASFGIPCLFPLTPRTKKPEVSEAFHLACVTHRLDTQRLETEVAECEVVVLMPEAIVASNVSWLLPTSM